MSVVELNNFHIATEAALWCKANLPDSQWHLDYSDMMAPKQRWFFCFNDERDLILFSLHWAQ